MTPITQNALEHRHTAALGQLKGTWKQEQRVKKLHDAEPATHADERAPSEPEKMTSSDTSLSVPRSPT